MLRHKNIFGTLIIISIWAVVSYAKTNEIEPPEVVEEQYLVLVRARGYVPADVAAAVVEEGGEVVSEAPEIGLLVARSQAKRFADKLSKRPGVQAVVPDLKMRWIPDDSPTQQAVTPEDEWFYGFQWNMPAISAPEAWVEGHTGAGVRVAVLDTGIDLDHPDLAANIDYWDSAKVLEDEIWPWPYCEDDNGHGTWTAGIIAAADNGMGVIGVAPEATIIVVKVLNSEGAGSFSRIIMGIIYAVVVDADVINMSLSGYLPKSGHGAPWPAWVSAYYLSLMNAAVNFAGQQGATVVCAAGNDQIDLNHIWDWAILPAEASNAMAASATGPLNQTAFDTPAFYTNYGTSVVDVAAPGGNWDFGLPFPYPAVYDWVFSTYVGGYAWAYGTSGSAPHVSGVAALIIGKNGGEMQPAQVKAIIEQSADDLGKPGMDDYYGRGRINAYEAVTK
jgi:subtilisin family serine protease